LKRTWKNYIKEKKMDAYSIVLYLHIVGVLGLFVALGIEWTGLRQIRSATVPEQVRAWMGILKSTRGVGFASMLTTVITGTYMILTDTGLVPWIYISILSLVLVIILSMVLTGPRMVEIGQALAMGKGSLTRTFYSLTNHPLLWMSIQTRIAIALGIVFLKITKPELAGSLITIGVAIVLGLATTLHLPQREQAHEGSAD
jgi:protein-S-isoprenylcysteine O-methyltransferase Ste14